MNNQTETNPISIERVESPLILDDFIPKNLYKFSGYTTDSEAEEMYTSLKSFLEVNQELILSQSIHDAEEYTRGFKQALALCKLWIDSLYLFKDDSNEPQNINN